MIFFTGGKCVLKHRLVIGSLVVAGLASSGIVAPANAQPQSSSSFGDILYTGSLKHFSPPGNSDEQGCKSAKGAALVRHQLVSGGIDVLQCTCVLHGGTWGKRKLCSIKYTAHLNQKAYDHALALDAREKKAGTKGGSER